MKSEIFIYPLMIKETYLDTFGHVNNAMYLTLLEEARWALLNKNGYSLKKIQETKIGPTILEIKLTFSKELRARDEVIIETQTISYEKKIGRIYQRIIRGEEVCCLAEFVISLFDLNQRKLIMPTKEWLEAIGVKEI